MVKIQCKRLACLILVFLLLASQAVYAEDTPNEPSSWAVWDIKMASVYNLGSSDSYTDYQSHIFGSEFLSVQESLENIFGVYDTVKVLPDQKLTRGVVIKELYDVVQLVLMLDAAVTESAAIDYFIENKLLQGKGSANYAVNEPCTKEQMLIFSKRV